MQFEIDVMLDYQLAEPADVRLHIEVAQMPDQRLIGDTLTFSSPEPLRPVAGGVGIGQRTWLRADGVLHIRYGAIVEVTRKRPPLLTLEAAPARLLPAEAVPYLLPSRYIGSEQFEPFVESRFGVLEGGAKVAAMLDWIAAEMATMAPADLSKLVLVGAMGIKPPQGDILDLAITGYMEYARAGFHDQKAFDRVYGEEPPTDQLEMWDICREMSFRIAWKPYMYSQTLPHLLGSVRVPALVVWGDDDKVVPQSAAGVYAKALPNAKLETVKASGHCVDMEQPEALAKLVTTFTGRE